MIFTTNKRLNKVREVPLSYVDSPPMTFSHNYRNFTAQTKPVEVAPKKADPEVPALKKMKWGEPTWFLFHTLAEKIKPEYFEIVKSELLNIIYTICANLPCPNCANHAVTYMKNINFNSIATKHHLRIMLYNFHNEVNKRKGFAEFPYEELSVKYSQANTVNIIHYFMPFFEDKHASIRMIADDLHRGRIAIQLKAWFNKNIGYFEL